MKEEIKTSQTGLALCKDPHLGTPNTQTGEAARSGAKLFSKSEPFADPPNPCRSCLNTFTAPHVKIHLEEIGHAL